METSRTANIVCYNFMARFSIEHRDSFAILCHRCTVVVKTWQWLKIEFVNDSSPTMTWLFRIVFLLTISNHSVVVRPVKPQRYCLYTRNTTETYDALHPSSCTSSVAYKQRRGILCESRSNLQWGSRSHNPFVC